MAKLTLLALDDTGQQSQKGKGNSVKNLLSNAGSQNFPDTGQQNDSIAIGNTELAEDNLVFLGEPESNFKALATPLIVSAAKSPSSRKGPPSGGGETAVNNLSFPVIWAEGTEASDKLALQGTLGAFSFKTPYDVNGDGLITDADRINGYYQFAQKTQALGNVWQADNVGVESGPVYVTEIDWGDSLESVDMKIGRPVRVELSLDKNLGTHYSDEAALPTSMLGFNMEMLANPSSKDEVQGAGATQYGITGSLPDERVNASPFTEATVYSPDAVLIIQQLIGTREDLAEGDLLWNGTQWVDNPDQDLLGNTGVAGLETITFSGELNVGGKVIYGLSQGGWKPGALGDYRITFYLPPDGHTQLDYAGIRVPLEEEVVAIAAEEGADLGGGTAAVVGEHNLTYIDISVVTGGGGGGGGSKGGGGGKGKPSATEFFSLGSNTYSVVSEPLIPYADDDFLAVTANGSDGNGKLNLNLSIHE